jgi:hypothetical protein
MKVLASDLRWRTVVPCGILLVLAFFHRQIDRSIAAYLLLNSESPREELFEETVTESNDPVSFLNRCWATGKVAHRQLVAAFLKDKAPTNAPWFARAEALVLAGATDGDASVKELSRSMTGVNTAFRRRRSKRSELVEVCLNSRLPKARCCSSIHLLTGSILSAEMGPAHRSVNNK